MNKVTQFDLVNKEGNLNYGRAENFGDILARNKPTRKTSL